MGAEAVRVADFAKFENLVARQTKKIEESPFCEKHPDQHTYPRCDKCYQEDCEEQIKREALAQQRYLQANIGRLLQESGAPIRIVRANLTLDSFKLTPEDRRVVDEFIERYDDGLFLVGKITGSGKTSLAVAIMREALLSGKKALFLSTNDLLIRIKSTYDKASRESEADILNSFKMSNLLVLDDLGTSVATEWVKATLEGIIDLRYRDMLPTIITTNLDLKTISKELSIRIASRINSYALVQLPKHDYRRKGLADVQNGI